MFYMSSYVLHCFTKCGLQLFSYFYMLYIVLQIFVLQFSCCFKPLFLFALLSISFTLRCLQPTASADMDEEEPHVLQHPHRKKRTSPSPSARGWTALLNTGSPRVGLRPIWVCVSTSKSLRIRVCVSIERPRTLPRARSVGSRLRRGAFARALGNWRLGCQWEGDQWRGMGAPVGNGILSHRVLLHRRNELDQEREDGGVCRNDSGHSRGGHQEWRKNSQNLGSVRIG